MNGLRMAMQTKHTHWQRPPLWNQVSGVHHITLHLVHLDMVTMATHYQVIVAIGMCTKQVGIFVTNTPLPVIYVKDPTCTIYSHTKAKECPPTQKHLPPPSPHHTHTHTHFWLSSVCTVPAYECTCVLAGTVESSVAVVFASDISFI